MANQHDMKKKANEPKEKKKTKKKGPLNLKGIDLPKADGMSVDEILGFLVERAQAMEFFYHAMARDLSVVMNALQTIKSILEKKKIFTTKQFDKEYEKQYDKMLKEIEKAQKDLKLKPEDLMSNEDIFNLMNDPNVGHS